MLKLNERNMTLGTDWRGENVTGWLLSEKLDGIRAFWDGQHIWTRGGKIIQVPAWLAAQLPRGRRLDGELWAGRGNLQAARLAVQHGKWSANIRFVVFDAPDASGTWTERMAAVSEIYFDCISYRVCESNRMAIRWMRKIQAAGGEGIVARCPIVTGYERGRSASLLKIKKS